MTDIVLAVFGGSFDPPHVAHLEVIRMLLAEHLADRVLVVPCIRHAFGKPLVAFEHRLHMARLLCRVAGRGCSASDVERRLDLSGYTVDTVEALAREHPEQALRLVVGSDILDEAHRWRRFQRVADLAPLIVVQRAGYLEVAADLPAPPDVSSTTVRRLIARGEPIDDLVPGPILEYIRENGLYTR